VGLITKSDAKRSVSNVSPESVTAAPDNKSPSQRYDVRSHEINRFDEKVSVVWTKVRERRK
jgi:hypothetical protein